MTATGDRLPLCAAVRASGWRGRACSPDPAVAEGLELLHGVRGNLSRARQRSAVGRRPRRSASSAALRPSVVADARPAPPIQAQAEAGFRPATTTPTHTAALHVLAQQAGSANEELADAGRPRARPGGRAAGDAAVQSARRARPSPRSGQSHAPGAAAPPWPLASPPDSNMRCRCNETPRRSPPGGLRKCSRPRVALATRSSSPRRTRTRFGRRREPLGPELLWPPARSSRHPRSDPGLSQRRRRLVHLVHDEAGVMERA